MDGHEDHENGRGGESVTLSAAWQPAGIPASREELDGRLSSSDWGPRLGEHGPACSGKLKKTEKQRKEVRTLKGDHTADTRLRQKSLWKTHGSEQKNVSKFACLSGVLIEQSVSLEQNHKFFAEKCLTVGSKRRIKPFAPTSWPRPKGRREKKFSRMAKKFLTRV